MRPLNLHALTDRGCWISDDRVYAFVSASGSVSQIGFHGMQPVSRNSRFFRRTDGAVVPEYRTGGGEWTRFDFRNVEWFPAGIRFYCAVRNGTISCDILADGSTLLILFETRGLPGIELRLRLHLDAAETDVQGVRVWNAPALRRNGAELRCRDRIVLKDWIRREGPYAGDFLIPEPWRRKIYARSCRSGEGTFDDVREEYRESDEALYDALTCVSIRGRGWKSRLGEGVVELWKPPVSHDSSRDCVELRFSTGAVSTPAAGRSRGMVSPAEGTRRAKIQRIRYDGIRGSSPTLTLAGFPSVEVFFADVPSLADSCRVRDFGMTRANPGAYYWIWAWDALVTAMEFSRWGDIENLSRTLRFLDAHRDVNGLIPARWTRDLQPLDTPARGFIEALFALLAYEHFLQSGASAELEAAWPSIRRHLAEIDGATDARGLMRNIGCYPDFPARFGRAEGSAVAMEIGANYVCARTMIHAATVVGDEVSRLRALRLAERIESRFTEIFYDSAKGFLRDAVDADSLLPNESFPLFSLLLLQSPLGWRLIEAEEESMACFVSRELLDDHGLSLLPPWDKNREAESVTHAWYPHWDIYALKLLRRAGDARGIMRWLNGVEEALRHLGYCPEFLSLDGFRAGDADPWRLHGAASNLNCVTGWYRALLEALIGIEFDPGGMTIVPLALPPRHIAVDRLIHRGTEWNILVRNEGPFFRSIGIDNEVLRGSRKIPKRYFDRGRHAVEIVYGEGEDTDPCFTSIVNGELLSIESGDTGVTATVNLLGPADIEFTAPEGTILLCDGQPATHVRNSGLRNGLWRTPVAGTHTLQLRAAE